MFGSLKRSTAEVRMLVVFGYRSFLLIHVHCTPVTQKLCVSPECDPTVVAATLCVEKSACADPLDRRGTEVNAVYAQGKVC